MDTVRTYVRRSQGKVRRFALGRSSSSQQAILSYVADRCKGLQEVCLSSSLISASILKAAPSMSNLRSIILSTKCDISLDTAIEVLVQCKQLEHAEFPMVLQGLLQGALDRADSFVKLHTLILDQFRHDKTPMLPLTQLLEKIPSIHSLRLRYWALGNNNPNNHGFSQLTHLEHLDIDGSRFQSFDLLPSTIRVLSVAKARCFRGPHIVHQHFPNLVRLSIAHHEDGRLLSLERLLFANKGNLLELNMTHAPIEKPLVLSLIKEGYFSAIETFHMEGCGFDDTLAETLVLYATSLRHLNLASNNITGVGVKALVNGLGSTLRFLNLNSCQYTSVDAVEWARSKGLTVHYAFPDNSGKGKKVRQA